MGMRGAKGAMDFGNIPQRARTIAWNQTGISVLGFFAAVTSTVVATLRLTIFTLACNEFAEKG